MSTTPPEGFGLGKTVPLVSPLYQSSVYTLRDLDALDAIADGTDPGYIYARDGHPNAHHLARLLARMESADWAVICSSGMAAISALVVSHLQQGDRIVASNRLYGRTLQLLDGELGRFGVSHTFLDTCDLEQVAAALKEPAKMLLVETMSNPLVRVCDLERVARMCKDRNCLLIVDNTFATPLLLRPLEMGADFVVESLTKMIGGHGDITLGMLCGKGEPPPAIAAVVSIWGFASNPFDCWLAERGLVTLPLRMQKATANAGILAPWLESQPAVARVFYPGLASHPDHRLASRLFPTGCGNMLAFELSGGRDAVNRFMRAAPGIPFSPSLGHTSTTCSHPATTSHRYITPAERIRQDITDGLIRLSVGIEEPDWIQEQMRAGLSAVQPS